MAYTNFKPTIWSRYIQQTLKKFTVLEQGCNHQFRGEVGLGKTVEILTAGRPTIATYTPGTPIAAPETPAGSKATLAIDQAKYFNFVIDDVDRAQAVEGLMQALMEEATRGLAEERDAYIASLAATAAPDMKGDAVAITDAATAKAQIDAALVALYNNGVPTNGGITIYLDPATYVLMKDWVIEYKDSNDRVFDDGVLGVYSGAKIRMSNNLYESGGALLLPVMTDKAIAFASCIEKVEAYRPQGDFSDAVKGLNTFGGKLIRPDELYVIQKTVG